MHDHVISGLTKRRADLTHEHDRLSARLQQIAAEVGHIDAVIRQFKPAYQPISVHPAKREDPVHRGQRSRMVLTVLREATEPLTAAQVVDRVAELEGVDVRDREVRRLVSKRIETALIRQERRGVLRSLRNVGQFIAWEVAR